MNKALNKYRKTHYQHTRYGIKRVARIHFLRRCAIGQICATTASQNAALINGLMPFSAKAFQIGLNTLEGAKAMKKTIDRYPMPKWYKAGRK